MNSGMLPPGSEPCLSSENHRLRATLTFRRFEPVARRLRRRTLCSLWTFIYNTHIAVILLMIDLCVRTVIVISSRRTYILMGMFLYLFFNVSVKASGKVPKLLELLTVNRFGLLRRWFKVQLMLL